jgi:hypothetical protein
VCAMMGILRMFLVFFLVLASAHAVPAQVPLVPKERLTPAQRKIDTQLLQEIAAHRDGKKGPSTVDSPAAIKVDKQQRALVDIRAEVTPAIEKSVAHLGGEVVSTSVEYRSIIAWVPVLKLEQLAADAAVRSIDPAARATIHR